MIGEWPGRAWVLLLLRIVVGLIFLIAGFDKLQAPGAFADSVRAFHMLPPSLVMPFALIVPWIELLVAVYLLAGFLTRIGAAGAMVLLASFIFALMDSLLTGNVNHACGCFGVAAGNPIITFLEGGNSVTSWDVIRDVILFALSALVLVDGAGPLSVDGFLARRRYDLTADDLMENAAS